MSKENQRRPPSKRKSAIKFNESSKIGKITRHDVSDDDKEENTELLHPGKVQRILLNCYFTLKLKVKLSNIQYTCIVFI